MSIPQSFIDDLLSRTDIVELIGSRVKLKHSGGSNYKGLCPFHQEKTPSFTVAQKKQFYYCFGCQATGNAISFLMEHDHLSFVEAVETLASRLGLTVPTHTQDAAEEAKRKLGYHLLDALATYYSDALHREPQALRYLAEERRLSEATIQDFRLGYATAQDDDLVALHERDPERIHLLKELGLLVERRGALQARFRHRVVFPIIDTRGRVVGFGARAMGSAQPKYLNSSESFLFRKKADVPYGIHHWRQCKQVDSLLVVEGYMDVLSCVQAGIRQAVACLGTAFSAGHFQQLLRYSKKIAFCFDGDRAGLQAARKAMRVILPFINDGMSIRFVLMPAGEDPDTLLRQGGRSRWRSVAQRALPFDDFWLQTLKSEHPLTTLSGKAQFARKALDDIDNMPNSLMKTLFLQKVSDSCDLDLNALESHTTQNRPVQTKPDVPDDDQRLHPLLAYLIRLMMTFNTLSHREVRALHDHQTLDPQIRLFLDLQKRFAHSHGDWGQLLEPWRETSYFEQLYKLAADPVALSPDQAQQVFDANMKQWLEFVLKQHIQAYAQKAKSQGLSDAEQAQLKALWAAKRDL